MKEWILKIELTIKKEIAQQPFQEITGFGIYQKSCFFKLKFVYIYNQ